MNIEELRWTVSAVESWATRATVTDENQ